MSFIISNPHIEVNGKRTLTIDSKDYTKDLWKPNRYIWYCTVLYGYGLWIYGDAYDKDKNHADNLILIGPVHGMNAPVNTEPKTVGTFTQAQFDEFKWKPDIAHMPGYKSGPLTTWKYGALYTNLRDVNNNTLDYAIVLGQQL